MSIVSTATTREAAQTISALEAKGIPVEGVEFDADSDTFLILLPGNGGVGTRGLGGGTTKDVDTQGLGGGTVKQADE